MNELQADVTLSQAQVLVESVITYAQDMGDETRERLANIAKDIEAIRMEAMG